MEHGTLNIEHGTWNRTVNTNLERGTWNMEPVLYTSIVTLWRRAIGVMTLVVLTMVPAMATMCAIVCHGDHHAAAHCQEEAASSSQFQLGAAPVHDCGSHGAIAGDVVIPAQLRMSPPVSTPSIDHHALHAVRHPRIPSPLTFASSAPPGSDPPTTIPSILRV
jgi:hypothetical protein